LVVVLPAAYDPVEEKVPARVYDAATFESSCSDGVSAFSFAILSTLVEVIIINPYS
jgi:hypothetical protein